MKLFDVYPLHDITIVKGEGAYLWDDQGREYLDMYGGHAVISVGHTHPSYVRRLKEQMDRIGFYSNSIRIPLQQELAADIGALSGKTEYQLFLCNSGAEANENALKLASFHTGRKRVVAFSGGFHGRTSLAVAATDNATIAAPVNHSDNVVLLPYNDVDALAAFFRERGPEIAAVIVEAIQGVGGIQIATDLFLQTIRNLCDAHGAVCIADEVQCGYGRTGTFFAFDHAGVPADIYTMAKGMGNGFPVGGIAIAPHIKPQKGMLGTTFGGNHLACAAALAVAGIIRDEKLIKCAQATGDYLLGQLRSISGLQDVRGRGLMIGFNVPEEHQQLRQALLHRHHIFTGEAKNNTIRLLPALTIGRTEADLLLGAIRQELVHIENLVA